MDVRRLKNSKSGKPTPIYLTAFEPLHDNADQARNNQRVKMTLRNSQANDDATRGTKRCGFFWFGFFNFSTAATAEGAGV